MGSTQSSYDRSLTATEQREHQRRYVHGGLEKKHDGLGAVNLYELFGLEKFAEITAETKRAIESECRHLCLEYHPDLPRNIQKHGKEHCVAMIVKTQLAKETLLTPDHKRRYDIELRGSRSGWAWWRGWGASIVMGLGGLAMVIAGVLTIPVTGGTSIALSIGGSSLLSAGVKTAVKMHKDPNCSRTEYLKDAGVGLLAGAAGGSLGVAMGAAMAGASVAAKVGHAAWTGASAVVASRCIEDATNLAINNTEALTSIKEDISDLKTNGEILSYKNAASYAAGAVIGACAGMAVQGVANAFTAHDVANKAAELSDDVANQANQVATKTSSQLARKMIQAGETGQLTLWEKVGRAAAKNAAKEGAKLVGYTSCDVANGDGVPAALASNAKRAAGSIAFAAANAVGGHINDPTSQSVLTDQLFGGADRSADILRSNELMPIAAVALVELRNVERVRRELVREGAAYAAYGSSQMARRVI
jgi:hypothetical protein